MSRPPAFPIAGFFYGAVLGVLLYLALDEYGLPAWLHVGVSALAVLAIPGFWWIVIFGFFGTRASRHPSPVVREWEDRQTLVWEQHGKTLGRVGGSELQRVIVGGTSVRASDTEIALVALEIRSLGGFAHMTIKAVSTKVEMDLEESGTLAVELRDDQDTDYATSVDPVQPAGGSGRFGISFVPAPPAEASVLTFTIETIVAGFTTKAINGPWTFSVSLAP